MIELLMMLSLAAAPRTQVAGGPFQTCQWPNKCAVEQVAQFQPCVWPNKCAVEPVAQVQTCVWPNKCLNPKVAVLAQFQPCVWPNKCSAVSPAVL